MVGFPELSYSQISVDKLHTLKAQCFTQKVGKINDKDHTVEAMNIRLQQLETRKEQLQRHKQDTQNIQISQLVLLKTSVISLQASQKVRPQTAEGSYIFKRDKPQLHKQLMTTIFSRAQKTKAFNNLTSVSIPKSDGRTSGRVQKEKQKQTKQSFKNVERKVAAVVKDGLSGNIKLNFPKLREEFDM